MAALVLDLGDDDMDDIIDESMRTLSLEVPSSSSSSMSSSSSALDQSSSVPSRRSYSAASPSSPSFMGIGMTRTGGGAGKSPTISSPTGRRSSFDAVPWTGKKVVYDWSKSTEQNFISKDPNPQCRGRYATERSSLDYSYHKHYSDERQLMHDKLIDLFKETIIYDGDATCDTPLENWVVFTAGPMGAGKSYVLSWLAHKGVFPSHSFVRADPDAIRELLPETREYIRRDPLNAGEKTQKEVGYICETLTLHALTTGKNVVVDGSLRDAVWYTEYFENLRKKFPQIKLAIFNITANSDTVLERCRRRALTTGRCIPEHIILDTMKQLPSSLNILAPLTNYVCEFRNEDRDDHVVEIIYQNSNPKDPSSAVYSKSPDDQETLLDSFRETWKMHCPYIPKSQRLPQIPENPDQSMANGVSKSGSATAGAVETQQSSSGSGLISTIVGATDSIDATSETESDSDAGSIHEDEVNDEDNCSLM